MFHKHILAKNITKAQYRKLGIFEEPEIGLYPQPILRNMQRRPQSRLGWVALSMYARPPLLKGVCANPAEKQRGTENVTAQRTGAADLRAFP